MQGLSSLKYIKNNKRRVAVLIVSLAVCFAVTYLLEFLLSTTTETFRVMMVGIRDKVQYIALPAEAFEIDSGGGIYTEHEKLAKELEKEDGVSMARFVDVNLCMVSSVVGNNYLEIPMFEKDDCEYALDFMDATLIDGKMPQNAGELVLDVKVMKNCGYKIGDSLKNYDDTKIVGIIDCDYYFGCGIAAEHAAANGYICVLSDGKISDFAQKLHKMGYSFDEDKAVIYDKTTGQEELQKEVIDVIDTSTNLIFAGILVVLILALFIVYTTYIRDRHNEYCLYCSIGYSRKAVYSMVMKELLFSIISGIILGALLTAAGGAALDFFMVRQLGMSCKYFYPDVIIKILSAYVLLLGLLQLPIRYALFRISTVDAIDDDL